MLKSVLLTYWDEVLLHRSLHEGSCFIEFIKLAEEKIKCEAFEDFIFLNKFINVTK